MISKSILSYFSGITAGQQALKNAFSGTFLTSNIDTYIKSLDGLSLAQKRAVINSSSLTAAHKKEMLARINNTNATNVNTAANNANAASDATDTASNIANTTSTNADTAATNLNTNATNANTAANNANAAGVGSKLKGVGAGLLSLVKAHPVITALTVAIGAGAIAWNQYKKAQEEAIKKTKEIQEEISQASSDYKNNHKTLTSLKKEYDSLTKKIGDNKAEVVLSADEYERYKNITSEILNITPQLITSWDAEGNAISDKNDLLRESIALLDEEYQRELRNNTTTDKNKEFAKGLNIERDKQKENIDIAEDEAISSLFGLFYEYSDKFVQEKDKEGEIWSTDSVYSKVLGDLHYYMSKEESFAELQNALLDENNPIHQMFTPQQIGELKARVSEVKQTIKDASVDIEAIYKQYQDQLQSTVESTGESYKSLSETTKQGISSLIGSFDFSEMTSEEYSSLGLDLKEFVENLSKDDTLASYFKNIFNPQDADESVKDYKSRVKNSIEEITKYCEKNYPSIELDFSVASNSIDNLEEKYDTAISKFTKKFNKEGTIDFTSGQAKSYRTYSNYNGEKSIVLTPILPDGTVLSEKQLDLYAAKLLNGEEIDVDIKMGMFEGKDSKEQANDFVNQVNNAIGIDDYFRENSINTADEIDYWNEVTKNATSATQAIRMYEIAKKEGIDSYSTFADVFNSTDFEETKESLLELAKSGTLTPETMVTVEGYNNLLDKTGLNAAEACEKIKNLTNVTERLADTSSDLDALSTIYTEFKEDGKASAESIQSAADTFGKLDSWKTFSILAGSSTTTTEQFQEAIDNLVSEFMRSEDALQYLDDTTKDYYVTQLKLMGISNAEEVVATALLVNTEKLALKEKALEGAVEGVTEATGENVLQLVENDEALKDNETAIDLTKAALLDLIAQQRIFNKEGLDIKDKIKALSDLAKGAGIVLSAYSGIVNGKNIADMTSEELLRYGINEDLETYFKRQKEEWDKYIQEQYDPLLEKGNDGTGTYHGSEKDQDDLSKEDSEETYDWIEKKIERLTNAYDKWKDKAGQAFRSVKARVEAYNEAIEDSNELIELNENAKEIYMNKANSVGLDEYYAKQVRDGSLNIETVDDETVREKIEEYTKWYDKARECGKAVKDLKLEQKELTRENIELVTSKYEKLFSRLESANDRISKRIDIKEALGFSASESDYNKMNDNIQKQIDYNDEMIIQLKKLQGTVKKGSIAWYEYQERIDSTTASTQDLTLSMIENAKAKAALAGEKAEKKVEKLDAKDELTDAKINNATNNKKKDALIDTKIGRIDKRQNVYDQAYKDSSNDLMSSKKSLLKKKNKKTNTKNKEKNKSNKAYNSVLNKVKNRIKSGKKIGQSLLNEVLKVDEGLHELCVQYNADFDAKVSNKDIADLYRETSKQDKADLAMEKFNNISTKYDNNNIEREHRKNSINAEMDLLTEQGKTVSTKYYQQLINEEKALQTSRLNQAKEMQAELDEAIKNGHIKVGSPEYYDAIKAINDINEAYEQGKITLEEYANAQRQIKWDALDKALESIKRINSETDYYIELMSNEKLVDEDTGNFTEYGIATLASRKVNMENYFSQAKEFQKKYNKLMQDIAEGKESLDDEKVVERLRYLEDGMRDATLAAKNEEQAIVDLVKQGYDAQLDSLNELIDKYKELKNSEKEAYEYQKQISEKTANITKLQKQLSALSSNDTEEAKAKIQKLKVELEDAETDLRETEYDKYLSDTENMLSDLYNDYEEFIDEKLNNVTELLKAIFASNLGDKDAVLATLEGLDLDKNVSELLKGIILGDTTTNKNATEETKKEDDKAKGTNTDAKSNTPSNSNTSKSSNIIDKTTESIISSNSVLGKIVSSSVKKIAEDYINKKANTTKKKKSEFKAVNQAIYKLTGGKVLSADEQKELAKKVGVTFNGYGKDDNLYQRLKLLGIKGFKVGSKNIPEDQLALLGEEGTELQFDTSQGVLRTIGKGDMIFTNEMSQRLWEMAKGNMFIPNLSNMDVKLPDVVTKNDTSNVNINLGGIVMNGVNDPEEFTRQLNSHLANNSTTIKLIQNQSVGALNKGYNSLSGRKF